MNEIETKAKSILDTYFNNEVNNSIFMKFCKVKIQDMLVYGQALCTNEELDKLAYRMGYNEEIEKLKNE